MCMVVDRIVNDTDRVVKEFKEIFSELSTTKLWLSRR